MPRELFVDAGECTGCCYCVDALPTVFRMSTDSVSEVINAAGADEAEIQRVIDNCPACCIHWR